MTALELTQAGRLAMRKILDALKENARGDDLAPQTAYKFRDRLCDMAMELARQVKPENGDAAPAMASVLLTAFAAEVEERYDLKARST